MLALRHTCLEKELYAIRICLQPHFLSAVFGQAKQEDQRREKTYREAAEAVPPVCGSVCGQANRLSPAEPRVILFCSQNTFIQMLSFPILRWLTAYRNSTPSAPNTFWYDSSSCTPHFSKTFSLKVERILQQWNRARWGVGSRTRSIQIWIRLEVFSG